MRNDLMIALALAMMAGCGDKSPPKTAATAPPMAAKDVPPSFVPTPPAQPNAVDDGVQRPAPGQANDHSSPEFKDGGQPDSKK